MAAVQQSFYLSGLHFQTRLLKKPLTLPLEIPAADVFLVDALPQTSETVQLATEVISASQERPVLVVSNEIEDAQAFALLSAGVRGLMIYAEMHQQLPSAMQVLSNGGFWIPRALLLRFFESSIAAVRRSRFALTRLELDERDSALLDAVLGRFPDDQIAARLHMPIEEVQSGVARLLKMFGVRRRNDLLLLPYQRSVALVKCD